MKIPGPDHPITITPTSGRVRVTVGGEVVVDTTRALTLKEASYPPVQYVPREDTVMAKFEKTAHATQCSYKGDASYYTVKTAGRTAENAVWSYEMPYPAMTAIKGLLAFYPNRVDSISIEPPPG
jgi:uncharacterized protein (DUF427 family)